MDKKLGRNKHGNVAMGELVHSMVWLTLLVNIILVIKSYKQKNLYTFIFFAAWLVLYTVQEFYLLRDLTISESVTYLNVTINQDGFKYGAFIHLVFLLSLLFISLKISKKSNQFRHIYACRIQCKIIYSVIFFIMLALLINKVGGLDILLTKSRPADEAGTSMFIFFLVSAKIFLIGTYNKKFDKYFLFLYVLSLLIFSLVSRLHLLMSIISMLTFYWIIKIKEENITIFNTRSILLVSSIPVIFFFMGIIKLNDNSQEKIKDEGLISYIESTLGSVEDTLYFFYRISIESFSNFAAFLSQNQLAYYPNFGVSQLDFFQYMLPSFIRENFSEITKQINELSTVKGNVPVIFTYMLESFHVLGIFIMALFICYFIKTINKMIETKNTLFFLAGIILINNSLLFIRGTPEHFLAYIFYDMLGLILFMSLSNKIKHYQS